MCIFALHYLTTKTNIMKLNLKGLSVEGVQHDEECIFYSDFYWFNFNFDELPEDMRCEIMLSIDQIANAYQGENFDHNGIEVGFTSYKDFHASASVDEWEDFIRNVAIEHLNAVNKDGNIDLTPVIQNGRFTKLLKKLFN